MAIISISCVTFVAAVAQPDISSIIKLSGCSLHWRAGEAQCSKQPRRNSMATGSYKPRQFDLSGLNGISDQTLEMHFKLYDGYVTNTNLLTEKIGEMLKNGQGSPADFPAYSELTRRLGFEYNGMVLHEYYFGNMKRGGGSGDPDKASGFHKAAEASCGGYDTWKADFMSVGKMRGVGWAVCYQD